MKARKSGRPTGYSGSLYVKPQPRDAPGNALDRRYRELCGPVIIRRIGEPAIEDIAAGTDSTEADEPGHDNGRT